MYTHMYLGSSSLSIQVWLKAREKFFLCLVHISIKENTCLDRMNINIDKNVCDLAVLSIHLVMTRECKKDVDLTKLSSKISSDVRLFDFEKWVCQRTFQ